MWRWHTTLDVCLSGGKGWVSCGRQHTSVTQQQQVRRNERFTGCNACDLAGDGEGSSRSMDGSKTPWKWETCARRPRPTTASAQWLSESRLENGWGPGGWIQWAVPSVGARGSRQLLDGRISAAAAVVIGQGRWAGVGLEAGSPAPPAGCSTNSPRWPARVNLEPDTTLRNRKPAQPAAAGADNADRQR